MFSRPLPMPPTPMKPSTIDSLAAALHLGFSLSSGCTPARPIRPARLAAPSADAASTSRRVHVSMSWSPVGLISVQHVLVTETGADLKDQAAGSGLSQPEEQKVKQKQPPTD